MEKYKIALIEEMASKGNREAIHQLEKLYVFNPGIEDVPIEKIELVERYLLELAENGDNHAMVSLGSMYYEGRGVRQSYKQAVKWYEKAAEKLDPQGLCYLGYCYYYGRDIDIDYEKAYACFSQAAFLEDSNGMFKLGDMFYFGRYVEEDKEAAFYWYSAADDVYEKTEYERASIEYRIGKCYLYGEGVEPDLDLALRKLQSSERVFLNLMDDGDLSLGVATLKKVRKEIGEVRNRLYERLGIE